ncbi:hypothetical protein BASA61_005538 [Batrachochytrium salamandrivorans]|nr:hypothetical protein BASA61_005538 [Batrachochytrium salamandrivorans]
MATDPVNCTESSCHGSGGSDMDDWENAEPIVVPQHVRQGHSIATSGTSGTTSWGDDTTAGNAESATHREGFPIIINSGSTRTEYVPQIKFLKRQPEQNKERQCFHIKSVCLKCNSVHDYGRTRSYVRSCQSTYLCRDGQGI